MLRLSTLGGLRLDRDEAPVTGPAARRRPLAILAVIASAGSRGITRDRLIGVLWPDSSEEQARHVLSQSLYALRKDLGQDDLLLNGGTLRLNPAVITSDVGDFAEALEAGELERAVEAYRGPFVDGFYLAGNSGFERWAEEERARLAAQYARAAEAAASAAGESGDHLRAAALWASIGSTDPLAVRPALGRARALAAAGDPGAALKLLRDYAALMAQEGLAVPADVAALEREIKAAAMPQERTPLPVSPAPTEPPGASDSADRREQEPSAVSTGFRHRALVLALMIAVVGLATLALSDIRSRGRRAAPVLAVGLVESHLRSDTLGLARALPDLITTQLANVPGLGVVSRGRLLEVLGGEAAGAPGALTRAARAAGAGEMVEGAVYPDGQGFRLDLRRVDLASGRMVHGLAVEAPDASLLVERAAAALASSFGLEGPSARLADVTSVSLVARRFYEEGLRSLYAGDHRTASQLFQAALADDSTFAMAAYYLARSEDGVPAESTASRWKRASALASRATERERLLILSGSAFALNDARTITFAESLAIRFPDDLDGRFLVGELRLTDGDFEGAIEAFLALARLDSARQRHGAVRCRACDAMVSAAWASLLADSLARAERLAREALRLNPGERGHWGLLWTVLLRREDYRGAMRALERQNQLSPGMSSPRELLALAALRSGDFDALDSLTRHMLVTSDEPGERHYALRWRASYLRERGRLAAALDTSRLSRRIIDSLAHGASPDPFYLLPEALALLDLGRGDRRSARAAADLFDSMAAMSNYPEPRMARHRVWMWTHEATARALAGDTAMLPELRERIAHMSRFSSYGRDRLMPRYVQGLLLEARGDLPAAAEAYRSSIWSPTENHVSPRLARVLLRLGRPDAAVRVVQSWVRGPLDAANQYVPRWEAHEALADAFDALGASDSAARHRSWVERSRGTRTAAARAGQRSRQL